MIYYGSYIHSVTSVIIFVLNFAVDNINVYNMSMYVLDEKEKKRNHICVL